MKQKVCLFLMVVCILMLFGCAPSENDPVSSESASSLPAYTVSETTPDSTVSQQMRKTKTTVLVPSLLQETVYQNHLVSIDASSTSDGYISVCYNGDIQKIKLRLKVPDGTLYTYTLKPGNYEVFPLSGGDGTYLVEVYENAYDQMYALAFSQEIEVVLSDEFSPYLYPNQYVWYTPESDVVPMSITLSQQSTDDLDYVNHVYQYIIENVDYDQELAETVPSGYLPEVDYTLASKKGICFDYASLMSALLRIQGIPTRLVVGYSGEQYHAWISVYLNEIGWVDNIIYFDGESWSLIDPTLGANSSNSGAKKYLGDGENYLEKYHY